mmetsp:Transcript_10077/g.24819  ORF Transcript_10077/g.24819 Transcript_10077/m.24819 type:complete len:206 (+) Transcript_10077:384-1001(+)
MASRRSMAAASGGTIPWNIAVLSPASAMARSASWSSAKAARTEVRATITRVSEARARMRISSTMPPARMNATRPGASRTSRVPTVSDRTTARATRHASADSIMGWGPERDRTFPPRLPTDAACETRAVARATCSPVFLCFTIHDWSAASSTSPASRPASIAAASTRAATASSSSAAAAAAAPAPAPAAAPAAASARSSAATCASR